MLVSELVRVELMGVFHRQLREKKWTTTQFLTAIRQFTNDDVGGFWTWVALDSAIVEGAARTFTTLPDSVFLRAADCLHLVTALHHGFSEIYTHDPHQKSAAPVLGLAPLKAPLLAVAKGAGTAQLESGSANSATALHASSTSGGAGRNFTTNCSALTGFMG